MKLLLKDLKKNVDSSFHKLLKTHFETQIVVDNKTGVKYFYTQILRVLLMITKYTGATRALCVCVQRQRSSRLRRNTHDR
jgi:hypothetical protein